MTSTCVRNRTNKFRDTHMIGFHCFSCILLRLLCRVWTVPCICARRSGFRSHESNERQVCRADRRHQAEGGEERPPRHDCDHRDGGTEPCHRRKAHPQLLRLQVQLCRSPICPILIKCLFAVACLMKIHIKTLVNPALLTTESLFFAARGSFFRIIGSVHRFGPLMQFFHDLFQLLEVWLGSEKTQIHLRWSDLIPHVIVHVFEELRDVPMMS